MYPISIFNLPAKHTLCFLLMLSIFFSCTQENSIKTNKLAQESSPYLLQHAQNPVFWQRWDNEVYKNQNSETYDKVFFLVNDFFLKNKA